jgi:hypothetical protein
MFETVNLNQATAVALELEKLFKASRKNYDHITPAEYSNGREQGFHLHNEKTHNAVSWAENRNSDDIVVYPASIFDFDASGVLTTDETYFRVRKYFGYGKYKEVAKFIFKFITQAKSVPYGTAGSCYDEATIECPV